MARVTRVEDQEAPAWEAAQDRLLELKDGESLTFRVNDDTSLIVLHVADLGYLVTGCGEGDRDYFTLIERALGDEPVTAFDGGNTNEYPRFAFVSEPLLVKAVETYYYTGQRDSECDWVRDSDAVYG
jgi:hypothetical protein